MDSFTEHDTIILETVLRALKRHSFTNSVAVGKHRSAGALASIIPLDLTKTDNQQAVLKWIQHPALKGVFVAPPCRTASAARNIELPVPNAP